jgi:hypothetical protein
MRNGISVYGSYEATDWTRCAPSTTTLVPQTAEGVVFATDVQDPTVLSAFTIERLSAETTTGVTVEGATSVRLTGLTIVGPLDAVNVNGVRLSDGASASLFGIYVPDFIDGSVFATGLAFGVRAEASVVTIEQSDMALQVRGGGTAYGVWLDDAGSSRILNTRLRAIYTDSSGSAPVTAGIRVRGGESLEVSGGSIECGESLSVLEAYGIDATDAGHVTVSGTRLSGSFVGGPIVGIRALRTRLSFGETAEIAFNNVANGIGILLRDAPASTVLGRVSVRGSPTATGVALEGDGAETTISNDIDVLGDQEATGVSMIDCAGAEPLLEGSVSASVLSDRVLTGATTEGVRALGDCHPRLTNATVSSSGREALRITGVRCGSSNGVSSRCSVNDSSITLVNTRLLPSSSMFTTFAVGVSCEGGCREIVGTTITGATQAESASFRSIPNAAYGIVLDATSALVSGNTITAGCADSGAGIRAINASSRIENNDASGISCTLITPSGDHYVRSAGLMVTGGDLDVDFNVFRGGGSTDHVSTDGPCTSAGVMGGSGRYRNNFFESGMCGVHYAFSEPIFTYTMPEAGGRPTVLVDNGFEPSSMALYVYGSFGALTTLTDIAQVNALPLPEVGGNVLGAPPPP